MANYKNSLGESELFGRMTAGFAKVCESVQSGRFVRNKMGVICESVCEEAEKKEIFTVHAINVSDDEGIDDAQYCGTIYRSEDEAIGAAEEAAVDYADDEDVVVFTVFGGEYENQDGDITGEGDVCLFSISNKDKETTAKAREAAGYSNRYVDAYVVDGKVVTEDDADVASATPEQINGSTQNVNEGAGAGYDIVVNGLKLGNITSFQHIGRDKGWGCERYKFEASVVPCDCEVSANGYYYQFWPLVDRETGVVYDDSMIHVDGGTVKGIVDVYGDHTEDGAREIAEEQLTGSCIGIDTTYGGGWVHSYLPEDGKIDFGHVGFNGGDNNVMDDSTYEITDVSLDSKDMSDKINAGYDYANRSDEEDDEDDVEESCGTKKPMKKLIPEGCCGGKKARKVLKEGDGSWRLDDPRFEIRYWQMALANEEDPKKILKLIKKCNSLSDKFKDYGMYNDTIHAALRNKNLDQKCLDYIKELQRDTNHLSELKANEIYDPNVRKKFLKMARKEFGDSSKVVTEKKVPLCKTCGNPLDETGTCQDCQGYYEVKEGEGGVSPAAQRRASLLVNAKANQKKVAKAIRDRKASGIVKEGLDYHENADKITKDDVFGMLVNLLYQIRDGVSVEEVTANPDMDEFDDYSLDEVLELAKKYGA